MLQKLRMLIEKYWDILAYLFFGLLTTVVNYAVYLPAYNLLGLSVVVSNTIAWAIAVAFAYLTNKPFVFKSLDWSAKTVVPELAKFVTGRAASWAMETAILWVSVELLGWNGNLWKLVTNVLVVIVNYLASKLLVFKK